MINPTLTAKIFSTLGNNSSLVPLGVKDVSNTLGLTAGSYITGKKVESKDRFIDEFGTQIIWLLGIPFFKKVIDKTVYKLAGFNPNIDSRVLKNKDVFEKAKKHALPHLKESFEKVGKNQKAFKNLAVGKFAASTVLTLLSYSALTKFRHKHTEKAIIEEIKKEEQTKQANHEFIKNKQEVNFNSFHKKIKQNPAFGINLEPLQQFMFDPVKNTMIIDGGITTQRLAESRNPQDFLGYIIKEGGFWAFMYFAGPYIQKKMEEKAAKSNKPINLDIRVLQDKDFQQAIKDKSIQKHLQEFSIEGSDAEIYESLFKQEDNLIVQMAKKSDIIKTTKTEQKEVIDTQHFIDIDQIRGNSSKKISGIKQKMQSLSEEFSKSGKTSEDFFKEIIKLKRMSIVKNIGASIAALGLIVPAIMVALRFVGEDNKEFMVKKQIHEKLNKEDKAK